MYMFSPFIFYGIQMLGFIFIKRILVLTVEPFQLTLTNIASWFSNKIISGESNPT